jgi:transcription elongation factor GreA
LTNDLVHLARSLQLDALEAAWSQAVSSPAPEQATNYAEAIDLLCDHNQSGRAFALASTMIDALSGQGAADGAIAIAMTVVRRGAHNEALARNLSEMLQQRFSDETWWNVLSERAGLDPASITAQALLEFDRLRRFTKGHVVYHAAGWGEAVVEDFNAQTGELTVTFASGRREDFPLDTVIDSFKPLDRDDLRAMKLQRMEELQRLAKEEPAALIRLAAKMYRGTIPSPKVKAELSPDIVPQKSWNSFWKRAKAASTTDPWLRVEGSATRPTFVLRSKPVGLSEEAATTLSHCNHLGERIACLRDYLARGQDEQARIQLLDLAGQTVEAAIQSNKEHHAHILDGVLFLVEHGRQAPVSPAEELRQLLTSNEGHIDMRAIDLLATQQSREHAVTLLPEALGENWTDRCFEQLLETPVSICELVVDKLVAAGQANRLLGLWDSVAPFPRRHPLLTYLICRNHADGSFAECENQPADVTVGRVLLHLARVLNADRKGNPFQNRLLSRLTSLLTGKRAFLGRALQDISKDDLASYLGITERSGEDFPQEITDQILRHVANHYPDLTAGQEKAYWEREDIIITTKAGLQRIKDEYRILVEEKIPANSKAIGAAASLGDLSENSEWESAMEEQRNLTARATAMDREVRAARLIADQQIPEDKVAPGNRVTFRQPSGELRTVDVLGPWDVLDDSTINYLAPIAHGLLGRKAGESGEVPGPGGPEPVTIERIERIEIL